MSANLCNLIKVFNVLNVDKDASTITTEQIPQQGIINPNNYIISDADEELLILIEFKNIVHLQKIKLYCSVLDEVEDDVDISAPKRIHVYKLNNLNVNFDDIKSLTPNKSISCSCKKLYKGQNIKLSNIIKFKKTKYVAIYTETNQNDTENTYINAISFHGRADEHKLGKQLTIKPISNNPSTENNKLFLGFDDSKLTDQPHATILKDIIAKCNSAEILPINTRNLLTNNALTNDECEYMVMQCKCFKRICNILTKYHQFISKQQQLRSEDEKTSLNEVDLDDIYGKYGYTNTMLLNDFNHLLKSHAD
eukprot:535745_1